MATAQCPHCGELLDKALDAFCPVCRESLDDDPEQESGSRSDEARVLFETKNHFHGGANWYFWIAALSVINSALMLSGSDWSFIVGLGITQLIDAIATGIAEQANESETVLKLVAFGLDLFVAGIVVGIGVLARKGLVVAFILGMLLYAMDGMIFLLVQDWLSIGFHVFALFGIWRGLQALWRLQQLECSVADSIVLAEVVEKVDQGPSQRFGQADQHGTR